MKTTTTTTTTTVTATTDDPVAMPSHATEARATSTVVTRTLKMTSGGALKDENGDTVTEIFATVPANAARPSVLELTVEPNGGTPSVEAVRAETSGSGSVKGSWASSNGDMVLTLEFPDDAGEQVEWYFDGDGAPPIKLKVTVKRLAG